MSDYKTYTNKEFRVFFFNGWCVEGTCDITNEPIKGKDITFIADSLNGFGPVYMKVHTVKLVDASNHILDFIVNKYQETPMGIISKYTLQAKYENKMVIHIGNSTVLHDMSHKTELSALVMKTIGSMNFSKFTSALARKMTIMVNSSWVLTKSPYTGYEYTSERNGDTSRNFKKSLKGIPQPRYQTKRQRSGIGYD